MATRTTALLSVFAALPSAMTAQDTPPSQLSEAAFERLHQQLRPGASEAWRTIPWKLSLLAGQRAAAKTNKPIFIWAMDGHPLSCT